MERRQACLVRPECSECCIPLPSGAGSLSAGRAPGVPGAQVAAPGEAPVSRGITDTPPSHHPFPSVSLKLQIHL